MGKASNKLYTIDPTVAYLVALPQVNPARDAHPRVRLSFQIHLSLQQRIIEHLIAGTHGLPIRTQCLYREIVLL